MTFPQVRAAIAHALIMHQRRHEEPFTLQLADAGHGFQVTDGGRLLGSVVEQRNGDLKCYRYGDHPTDTTLQADDAAPRNILVFLFPEEEPPQDAEPERPEEPERDDEEDEDEGED